MRAGQGRDGARGILSYFTRHGTAANLLMVVLVVLGLAALPRMRAQFFPDVVIESVTVSVVWKGAGAQDVDTGIVQVLTPALLAVEGVDSSTARASEGRALISLDFRPGWDMARAEADTKAAVESVTGLPANAEAPKVRRVVWRDRVTDVVISGPVGVDQLGRFADEFVTRLFAAGVTRATIRGVAAPQTIVEVPMTALVRHDVTMEQIAAAIAREAAANPAGNVSRANARVRTGVARRSADAIAGVVIRSGPGGAKLTVGDIARVRVAGADRVRSYFVGRNPAISISIDRSSRGDAIAVQKKVQKVADALERTLPGDVKVDLIRTRAAAITSRLDILIGNGLMGLGLVLLLLFLFLDVRTAFWVAAGIPVAMLATAALMYAFGLTINMISLFALIITTGMIVDDAIVVGEHADFRAGALGEGPAEAAENAARRMAGPVFASTITTVIAFFSLVVVGGRFGNLIADIPFTVSVVLLASLVECFLILPNHMSHALVHATRTHWHDWPSRWVNRGFDWLRRVLVRRLVAGLIRARYPVIAGAVLLLASQVAGVIRGDVAWRFFNAPERGSVTGNFAMAPGATRADTVAMLHELQRATDALGRKYQREYGRNPLAYVLAEVGGNTGRGLAGAAQKDADLLGSISIELIDADLRPYSSFRFVGELQRAVRRAPLLEALSFRGGHAGPGGDSLSVQLSGAGTAKLKAAAEALKAAVTQIPEVSGVEDSLAYDKRELILDLTPQGQALGFTIDGLGRVLRERLGGIEAASYPVGPRSATIRVELPARELTADFLERTQMRTPAGNYVPLSDIVSVTQKQGFSTIRRENGVRVVTVTGDIAQDDPARATEIMTALKVQILPEIESGFGVNAKLTGLAEQENRFLSDALLGFLMGLVGIYLALAWIFSSWTRPLIVMAIIPFGLIGVIYGHALWGIPLSMFSVVGMIGMSGIIINDAIVLVSTIDEYAAARGLIPAIIDGVNDRLRAVLLTTLTTVFGLAPLLYESSQQAQFLKPTVITLVYGLGFGVVLVLFLVPALIAVEHDVVRQLVALRRVCRARRGLRAVLVSVVLAGMAIATLFAATLGHVLLSGALPAPLLIWLPMLAQVPALASALALFAAGSGGICILAYLLGGLGLRLSHRAA